MITSVVDTGRVAGLAALLELPDMRPALGDALPPLWHWSALPTWPDASVIGPDGHPIPAASAAAPPGRRMFAGGRVELHGDLVVGAAVRSRTRVLSDEPKEGRQGAFVLRTVLHEVLDVDGRLLLREEQDLVYLEPHSTGGHHPSRPAPQHPVAAALLANGGQHWRFTTDPTRLFRFSALTGNSHRIHYDWPYATGVEGYPDLVVHGPLMSVSLASVALVEHRERVPQTISHRNLRPLFCGAAADIVLREDGSVTVAEMVSGGTSVHARVEIRWSH